MQKDILTIIRRRSNTLAMESDGTLRGLNCTVLVTRCLVISWVVVVIINNVLVILMSRVLLLGTVSFLFSFLDYLFISSVIYPIQSYDIVTKIV